MVDLGRAEGVTTVALLTDMSIPFGLTAGNALEVAESVEVLAGGGPPDVVELTVALAREMVAAVGRDDHDPADLLASGAAMDVWRAMISAQGGDPDAELPSARETEVITAEQDGVLQSLDALAVGEAAWRLGAGRARKEHAVQAGAGVQMHAKPGMRVHAGSAVDHAAHRHAGAVRAGARSHSQGAYAIGDAAPRNGRSSSTESADWRAGQRRLAQRAHHAPAQRPATRLHRQHGSGRRGRPHRAPPRTPR